MPMLSFDGCHGDDLLEASKVINNPKRLSDWIWTEATHFKRSKFSWHYDSQKQICYNVSTFKHIQPADLFHVNLQQRRVRNNIYDGWNINYQCTDHNNIVGEWARKLH